MKFHVHQRLYATDPHTRHVKQCQVVQAYPDLPPDLPEHPQRLGGQPYYMCRTKNGFKVYYPESCLSAEDPKS